MAKSRESASTRDRTPPPPRMTGVGLGQMAIFSALMGALMAFLAVFMASSGGDDTAMRRIDEAGATLCALLSAPEPESWRIEDGTSAAMLKWLKEYYQDLTVNRIADDKRRQQLQRDDLRQSTRNKERLGRAASALGNLTGLVRGFQLTFSIKEVRSQYVGARIDPKAFLKFGQIGQVEIGKAPAAGDGGTVFSARVYRRPYMNARGLQVGEAFIVLSQAAAEAKKSAGMWLLLGPLLVGIAGILMIANASKAAAGVKSLARDLDMIGRGKLDIRVTTSGSGEVGFAQRTAERMAKNLQLLQSTGSSDLDEAIEKEMDLASEIHQSLRPNDPPRVPGYELETLFKGGSEIGGDYFDYIELDNDRLALLIADCSDSLRGVPAAMVMAMTRAYLKAAIDPGSGPADWLKWVNRRLSRDLKSGMAVTALIAVLETSKGEIVAASAGHRPIVMWRKGKTAMINPNGIALGLDVGPVFDKTIEEKRFSMHKNDRIVMYTDGVISAENEAGEQYGEERFLESVRRQGAMNSAAFVNFVAGGVEKYLDGREQPDDITISTLKKMK